MRGGPVEKTAFVCLDLTSSSLHSVKKANFNFWILPVDVFGSGPNSTVRGALKWARCPGQKGMIPPAVAVASGFKVTKAQGVSPHIRSGRATTAASRTQGWR